VARTLAFDIGGTGLKASVLDGRGTMVAKRVRIPTSYPCPPAALLDSLASLAEQLPEFDRIAAGFPGMVRRGRVLSAPHFITRKGPGTQVDPRLVRLWARFDLASALAKRLGKPAKVANDADIQGAAVAKGKGLELVITLGTGVGTALFDEGLLMPHLELAHHPLHKGGTYNERLGEAARKKVGTRRWSKRVHRAIETLRALTFFDHCYVGGGNAARIRGALAPGVSRVDNAAGVRGGISLWERASASV
jgi:polyphosphate glucokinase